jgi:alpha-acetolactate decarboxylase
MKKIFKKNIKHWLQISFLGGLFLISNNIVASSNNPFSVKDYGNFTHMVAVKSAPSNVSLQPMQGLQHLYGLGALQSLQGEITIIDGNVLISYGTTNDGHTTRVTSQDNATILATASVKNWIPVAIPSNLKQLSFEEFVLEARSKYGIPIDAPFPFLVTGEIKNLHWHVVNGLNFPAKKSASPAHKKNFEAANTNGSLIGFYSGKQLEGVISHPGERFHLHFTDANFTHAGHVDDYTIGANATLFLPKN